MLVFLGGVSQAIHRLVAKAFVPGETEERWIVAHNNGVRNDNRPCNLRWATFAENNADKKIHGTQTAKLSEVQVAEIRRLYATGDWTHRELARTFKIGKSAINDIIQEHTWKAQGKEALLERI